MKILKLGVKTYKGILIHTLSAAVPTHPSKV